MWMVVMQGVLVCLFTTVGGVMLIVFCLIIVQECKVRTTERRSTISLNVCSWCGCGRCGPDTRTWPRPPTWRSSPLPGQTEL